MSQYHGVFKVGSFNGEDIPAVIATVKELECEDKFTAVHLAYGIAYKLSKLLGAGVYYRLSFDKNSDKDRYLYVCQTTANTLYIYRLEYDDDIKYILLDNGTPSKQFYSVSDAIDYLEMRIERAEQKNKGLTLEFQSESLSANFGIV